MEDMTLNEIVYEIERVKKAIESGFDVDYETGEIFDQSTIDALDVPLKTKLQGYGFVIKDYEGMVNQADAIIEAINANKERYKSRIEQLKSRVLEAVEAKGSMIETTSFRFSKTTRDKVEILDESLIPEEYMAVPKPPAPKPDKRKIKEAIKDGEIVPGAALVKNSTLVVR